MAPLVPGKGMKGRSNVYQGFLSPGTQVMANQLAGKHSVGILKSGTYLEGARLIFDLHKAPCLEHIHF